MQTKHWVSILKSLDYRREMFVNAINDLGGIMVETWKKVVANIDETIEIIKREQPEAFEAFDNPDM